MRGLEKFRLEWRHKQLDGVRNQDFIALYNASPTVDAFMIRLGSHLFDGDLGKGRRRIAMHADFLRKNGYTLKNMPRV